MPAITSNNLTYSKQYTKYDPTEFQDALKSLGPKLNVVRDIPPVSANYRLRASYNSPLPKQPEYEGYTPRGTINKLESPSYITANKSRTRKTLVLDLDETLVHSVYSKPKDDNTFIKVR